jgi:hypothetical protein
MGEIAVTLDDLAQRGMMSGEQQAEITASP